MASLTTIRAGIAANLRAITGLQVSTWALANPTPPCIEIVPGPIAYDEAFNDGAHTYNITVRVFVGMVSEIGAQKLLDQFLASTGPKSV